MATPGLLDSLLSSAVFPKARAVLGLRSGEGDERWGQKGSGQGVPERTAPPPMPPATCQSTAARARGLTQTFINLPTRVSAAPPARHSLHLQTPAPSLTELPHRNTSLFLESKRDVAWEPACPDSAMPAHRLTHRGDQTCGKGSGLWPKRRRQGGVLEATMAGSRDLLTPPPAPFTGRP